MMSDAFLKDATISWLEGELAAANTIIVALCGHLSQLDGGKHAYDSVFAAINRRRSNWIPILQKHNHLSIANVTLDLQKVLQDKQKTPQVLLQSGGHSYPNDDSFIHRGDLTMMMDQQKAIKLEIVSQPKQRCQAEQPTRNWLDLPPELMANILYRIGIFDILLSAQNVCTAWHEICKDPATWRVIYVDISLILNRKLLLDEMCKHVVDRSQGQLVDFTIVEFGYGDILLYIANRSSQLKRLTIACCDNIMYGPLTESLKKFPLLEELNLYETEIWMKGIELLKEVIEAAGRYCPMLRTLKLNQEDYRYWDGYSDGVIDVESIMNDSIAMAIGQNLRELTHLELIGNPMSNKGLEMILDGCHHLELLDLRGCLFIDLNGDLGKRCLKQIKNVKLPYDSLKGCTYIYEKYVDDESEGGFESDCESYDEYEGISDDESEEGSDEESDDDSEMFYW